MPKSKIMTTDRTAKQLSTDFSEILKFIPNLVYWVDVKGRLQGCNDNFRRLLKISDVTTFSKNVYSSLAHALDLNHDDFKQLQQIDKDVMLSNIGKHNLILTSKATTNKSNSYLCDHHPLHTQSGEVIGAVTVIMLADNNIRKQPIVLDHNPKVLIVEDNPIASQATQLLFTKFDCQVDHAESAERAKELFHPGKYDLAIMDVELEDGNGYAITRTFRLLEKGTQYHVPIVALTSHGAKRVKFYCDGKKMDGALTKPLTSQQAVQVIDKFVFKKDGVVTGLEFDQRI